MVSYWLLSLNIMCLNFLHAFAWLNSSILFKDEYFLDLLYNNLLFQSTTERHFGFFQVLAATNEASITIHVLVFVQVLGFNSFGKTKELDHMIVFSLVLQETSKHSSKVSVACCISISDRAPVASHPHLHLVLSVFWIWAFLIGASCILCLVAQSCPTLCDPMDCSPPGFSVHGISQARILEWIATSFSRGSSLPRDRTQVCHIAGRFFTV